VKIDSQFILKGWEQASKIPFGKCFFSFLVKRAIPYTGALGCRITQLEAGRNEIQLKDRRGVRNHLDSVHAMALANLGEFSTGLAVVTALPTDMRAILKGFQIEYLKKARGTLIAKAEFKNPPSSLEAQDVEVIGNIYNSDQEIVARVKALWRVGKNK